MPVSAAELLEQAHAALGASAVSEPVALAGGASRALWSFDAELPGGKGAELVLLVTKGTAEQEWEALRAAHARGIAVAEPFWRTPDGEGIVLRRLAGEAIPSRIFREERFAGARGRLLSEIAAAAAAIHAIPLGEVPAVAGGKTGADAELDVIEAELRRYGDPHPALELGLRWLRQKAWFLSDQIGGKGTARFEPVLVHGDFRMGNMLVDADGLVAVLDWELVHAGNPAEDLGWLCARTWRFGRDDLPAAGLGRRRQLLDAYAGSGGAAIDPEELRFWEALANLRWGVLTLRQLYDHTSGERPSLELAAIGRRTCEAEWDLLAMVG